MGGGMGWGWGAGGRRRDGRLGVLRRAQGADRADASLQGHDKAALALRVRAGPGRRGGLVRTREAARRVAAAEKAMGIGCGGLQRDRGVEATAITL